MDDSNFWCPLHEHYCAASIKEVTLTQKFDTMTKVHDFFCIEYTSL